MRRMVPRPFATDSRRFAARPRGRSRWGRRPGASIFPSGPRRRALAGLGHRADDTGMAPHLDDFSPNAAPGEHKLSGSESRIATLIDHFRRDFHNRRMGLDAGL